MGRGAALLIVALATALPAQAQDTVHAPNSDGMTPAIAQCLQQNAAAVESAEPDLTKATDYLVADVCAVPVADEQQSINAERTRQMAERNRAQCLDRVAQQKTQDAALPQPRNRTYENCQLQYDTMIANASFPLLIGIGLANRPPAAVSMAAKLILERRLAHNQSRP
jgi:hypothetical protein